MLLISSWKHEFWTAKKRPSITEQEYIFPRENFLQRILEKGGRNENEALTNIPRKSKDHYFPWCKKNIQNEHVEVECLYYLFMREKCVTSDMITSAAGEAYRDAFHWLSYRLDASKQHIRRMMASKPSSNVCIESNWTADNETEAPYLEAYANPSTTQHCSSLNYNNCWGPLSFRQVVIRFEALQTNYLITLIILPPASATCNIVWVRICVMRVGDAMTRHRCT